MDAGSASYHRRVRRRWSLLRIPLVRMRRQFAPVVVWKESGPQAELTRARSQREVRSLGQGFLS